MDLTVIILLAVFLFGGVLATFVLFLWLAFRDEAKKRETAHAERMRALELGIPLPDAQVARYQALGWIGAGVPMAALLAAVGATCWVTAAPWVTGHNQGDAVVWSVVAIWSGCAALGAVALLATIPFMREKPPMTPSGVAEGSRASSGSAKASLGSPPDAIDTAQAVFEKGPGQARS